jgi:uncharacterized membrane protein
MASLKTDEDIFLRRLQWSALAVCALMLAGIGSLMFLARGKDEDITGIVAPALLVTIVAGGVALLAAVKRKRVE